MKKRSSASGTFKYRALFYVALIPLAIGAFLVSCSSPANDQDPQQASFSSSFHQSTDSEGAPLESDAGSDIEINGSRTWWYKKNGSTYKICKDRDGYRVTLPGGSTHNYGTGWDINSVKSRHGLSGISPYKNSNSSSDCR